MSDEIKKCEECGRTDGKIYNSVIYKKVLCIKHYTQMYRHGKIFERTRADKNDIIEDGEISYIVLRNMKQEEVARVIIDTEDLEELSRHKWSYHNSTGYAVTRINKASKSLHRLIVGDTGKLVVDHINRNKLDCRKENLRIITQQENSINRSRQSNNKSGITGVFFNDKNKKWVMTISISKKPYVKEFKTKEEAIKARLESEKLYYAELGTQQYLFEEYSIV